MSLKSRTGAQHRAKALCSIGRHFLNHPLPRLGVELYCDTARDPYRADLGQHTGRFRLYQACAGGGRKRLGGHPCLHLGEWRKASRLRQPFDGYRRDHHVPHRGRTLSHEHTIFRDAIFPDACARTWWEIGGGKKHHQRISRWSFFRCPRGRGGESEGAKKHHAFSRRSFFRMPSADVVGILALGLTVPNGLLVAADESQAWDEDCMARERESA
jgi:hypothetical protein